jgi:hypothetical protein
MRAARLLSAALLASATLIAGGCSSGSGGPALPTKSGATVPGADLADKMAAEITKAGSGSYDVTVADGTSHGDFAYDGDTMNQHLTVKAGALVVELVSLDGEIYAKGIPGQATPWVTVDPKATDPGSRTLAAYGRNGLLDPKTLAGLFKGELSTVQGSANGMTNYAVAIDPAKIAQAAGGAVGTGPDEGKGTVSVDAKGLPTRVEAVFGDKQYVITYTDWGGEHEITAPPKDQVGVFTPVG